MEQSIRFAGTTAGYFSHLIGAKYYNPIVTGAKYPDLVEIHESIHRDLAAANTTDLLSKLFTLTLEIGKTRLTSTHALKLRIALKAFYKYSLDTHETVATYGSLINFGSQYPELVAPAKAELPCAYRKWLRRGENAFGEVTSSKHTKPFRIITSNLIFLCGVAALNLDYRLESVDFDRADECGNYINMKRADLRFRRLLAGSCPVWNEASPFKDVPAPTDVSNLSGFLNEMIAIFAKRFSAEDISFRRRFDLILTAFERNGLKYDFIKDVLKAMEPDDDTDGSLGIGIIFPALSPERPLDMSLAKFHYRPSDPASLLAASRDAMDGRFRIFIHVLSSSSRAEEYDSVNCLVIDPHSGAIAAAISTVCRLDQLTTMLCQMPRDLTVVKVDERAGRHVIGMLSQTGLPLFVLMHDTQPKLFMRLATENSKTQKVTLFSQKLADRFSVMAAYLTADKYCVICPMTRLGVQLVHNRAAGLKNLKISSTPFAECGIDEGNFWHMVQLCFGEYEVDG